MTVEDVDFDQDLIYVLGKGRRERACPFGRKTAMALDRYVRNRGGGVSHGDLTRLSGSATRFVRRPR
jgi:site-specific recombinase XerC